MKAVPALSAVFDPLPMYWSRTRTAEGDPIYVHSLTGLTQHEKPRPLPPGWRMTRDKPSGQLYYWNIYTRETRPFAPPAGSALDEEPTCRRARARSLESTRAPPRANSLPRSLSYRLTTPTSSARMHILSTEMVTPPMPPPSLKAARRVRLSRADDIHFGVEGGVVVITRLSDALAHSGVQRGDLLVSVDGVAVDPDPHTTMMHVQRATSAQLPLDVEVVPAELFSRPVPNGESKLQLALDV